MPSNPRTHHRRSVRLSAYDYGQVGAYFVTLCTCDRKTLFDDPKIREIAEACWLTIPHFDPAVELDEWVLMPNHMHAILVLGTNQGVLSNAPTRRIAGNRFSVMSPQRGTLGLVIRKYKSAVTGKCRAIDRFDFAWQRGYYEHVIRGERQLHAIREYITNNPANWDLDCDNRANFVGHPRSRVIDDYLKDIAL